MCCSLPLTVHFVSSYSILLIKWCLREFLQMSVCCHILVLIRVVPTLYLHYMLKMDFSRDSNVHLRLDHPVSESFPWRVSMWGSKLVKWMEEEGEGRIDIAEFTRAWSLKERYRRKRGGSYECYVCSFVFSSFIIECRYFSFSSVQILLYIGTSFTPPPPPTLSCISFALSSSHSS